ncbi:hypothetical protein RclHR1_08470008 [Rhizophagus clarus]|uniref:SET domain-containing protein n=1 Tax=Rhizophagus clarus TaxID=94130 RepID=A0A2Z6SN71_9GLOM|nr:hypothetical protein RclHR1_08470008 [Rhizophagus clarus]GES79213.1 hypothetical protein RCL_jg6227.t1 [Rhizophagus clarus]
MDELLEIFLKERKSRQILIANYEKWLNNIEQMRSEKLQHLISTNNFGYRQNIQNTIKPELNNRISIANLEVDKVHTGKFLLCQVISRCVKMSPLFTLVEDPEGDVERIALYNWAEQSAIPVKDRKKVLSIGEASKFLPVGTKLVIKNPYYQTASSFDAIISPDGPSISNDFDVIIRSDNPNDIIVINKYDDLLNNIKWFRNLNQEKEIINKKSVYDKILSADDFRQSGNKYFVSNDFVAACDEYSNGIELDSLNVTLLANRAEAYLRLNQFDKALNDVEIALKHEPDHLKAAFRKGKALCGLKRYQEAIITLKDLDLKMQISTDSSISSIKQSTKILLKHAEMLDSESRYGKYDYIKIIDEFCEKVKLNQDSDNWVCETGPRLDHADFLIDDIEIRPVKKKGRGWVSKRDIPEGTLLMVSKAFEVVYGNEAPLSYRSIDFTSKTMITATHSELTTRIAQRLIAEPDLCQEVYKLYAGPETENLRKDLLYSVDVRRIEKIVKYNYFETRDQWDVIKHTKENSRLTKDPGAGLWILPSYFNHSCVDTNVEQLIIGNMMFIRSCRPILSGEELILSYCSRMDTYEERSNSLRLHGIKNCSCRLCSLERSESKKIKLRQADILETYGNSLGPQLKSSLFSANFNPSIIKELIKLIDELKDLRKEHPDLEFKSFEIKSDLAAAYVRAGNLRQSLPVAKELYEFVKNARLSQFSSNAAYQVASRYARLNQMKEAKEWWDVALKELVEPIRGKFNEGGTNWRKEAVYLAEKLSPKMVSGARNKDLL